MNRLTDQASERSAEGPEGDSPLGDCVNYTLDAPAWSFALSLLGAADLQTLSSLLHERAERRRVLLTYDEAVVAMECAPIRAWSERSPHADALRIRVACRVLVERGWHESQIIDAMQILAYEVSCHPYVARVAVQCGVDDGIASLKLRAKQ